MANLAQVSIQQELLEVHTLFLGALDQRLLCLQEKGVASYWVQYARCWKCKWA